MRKQTTHKSAPRRGFTLVELLVVLGIIALLISLLLPAFARARSQALAVTCKSQMKQVYYYMQMYAEDNQGYIFPPGLGSNILDPLKRWPTVVVKQDPPVANPPILVCQADNTDGLQDITMEDKHSYVLNNHIIYHKLKFTSKSTNFTTADVVVMGEKTSIYRDYYMELEDPGIAGPSARSDYDRLVELYRHGLTYGSNLLFMDGHVAAMPSEVKLETKPGCIDPWEPAPLALIAPPTTQPAP